MNHHAIERTSPKGEDSVFVGACRKCGKTGLTNYDFFHDECPNIRGTTQEQDVLEAIDPDVNHDQSEPPPPGKYQDGDQWRPDDA